MKNIKALGLAALVVAALAALPASASATSGLTLKGGTSGTGPSRITSSILPAKLSGGILNIEMEGWGVAGEVPFKFGGPGVECGEIAYEGSEFSEALYEEFILNAKFAKCTFLGYEAAIKMNSCHYQFSALDAVKSAATASIVCNKGDAIAVEAKTESGINLCTVTLPSQTLTEPAGVESVVLKGEGKIAIAMTGGGLEYTAKGLLCSRGGVTPGTFKNGSANTYMLLHAVKGSGGESKVPGLTIKGGTPETGASRITSSVFPAKLSGGIFNLEGWAVAGQIPFRFGGPGVECGEIAYEGPEFSEALVKEFTLNAKFAECSFVGFEAAIKMNSCHYQFSALDAVKSEAIASIVCNKGDAIVVEAKGSSSSPCTVELPSQTLTEPAGVFNPVISSTGEGKIAIAMTGGGLEYTAKGLLCSWGGVTPGTFKNGAANTYMLLHRA